jgi:hypothetical protein
MGIIDIELAVIEYLDPTILIDDLHLHIRSLDGQCSDGD